MPICSLDTADIFTGNTHKMAPTCDATAWLVAKQETTDTAQKQRDRQTTYRRRVKQRDVALRIHRTCAGTVAASRTACADNQRFRTHTHTYTRTHACACASESSLVPAALVLLAGQ